MVYRKTSLIKFAALLLTAAAITPAAGEFFVRGSALAQQSFGENPASFPVPASLPEGATLEVDGSTSMRVTNEDLESRFEQQYPNVDVGLNASRTDEAVQALLAGEIDLVATGRPLTDEEKAQGLIEVPLEREKIAILLGPDNPYQSNISFDQFARIFRGEITNWSELGGPDLPIRVVDRPEYSDTRRALSTYQVFQNQPFQTGATADPVAEDETDAVVSALGNDGIGYAVFSQVDGRSDVRIEPMHQTLPDDPRYPYSQYRAYVYKEGATPAALAFLGLATGQQVATTAPVPPAATPTPEATPAPTAAPETTAQVPAAETQRRGFPWWWLLLLLPLLLLPLLFRGRRGAAPVAAPVPAPVPVPPPIIPPVVTPKVDPRIVLTPRNCRDAYAYWEIPSDRLEELKNTGYDNLKVRLYEVTGRAKDAALPPHTAEFDCRIQEQDLHLPIAVDDRDYRAEIGYLTRDDHWVALAKSEPVRVPACPQPAIITPQAEAPSVIPAAVAGVATAATVLGASSLVGTKPVADSRIILTPRSCRDAYAYWEIPASRFDELQRHGGEKLMVRLYDVTNRVPLTPLPDYTEQFEYVGVEPDMHIPIAHDNRDYVAEIGYLTADNRWLPLAKSDSVRVPACEPEVTTGAGFPGTAIAGAAAVGAAAVGAVAVGASELLKRPGVTTTPVTSRIVLTPRTENKGYAYWEVPDAAKAALKAEGGRELQLRIYDVTGIDLNHQPPHSVVSYDVAEFDSDRFVPLPETERDYLAEIGYRTEEGGWLELARSLPVRTSHILGKPLEGSSDAALGIAAGVAAPVVPSPSHTCTIQTVKVNSRENAVHLAADQMRHLQDSVATNYYLDQGLYILRLRDGVFNYDGDETHPGEPFVLLWIYGGTVVNQKTGVPVNATWSTLNGYADTLTLDVREPATVCGFYMDTYPDDNIGEVTLSVIKL